MSITIHGFLLEPQTLSAQPGIVRIKETCLIELESPLDDAVDLQKALPTYGNGTFTQTEPTFTLGLSYHPERPDLVLKSADNCRTHEAGRPYWLLDLTYETAVWIDENTSNGGMTTQESAKPHKGNVGRRKKQTKEKKPIYEPWNEPVIWSGSTKSVKATVFQDSTGIKLLHGNKLPLTEGIDVDISLEHHQFNWNISATVFKWATTVAPYVGKINDAVIPKFGGAIRKSVYLESLTATENYRTVNVPLPLDEFGAEQGTEVETYHFYAMTASFLVDRRQTVEGYFREANRRVSMHTQQQTVGAALAPGYIDIPINDFGTTAKSPWPLLSNATSLLEYGWTGAAADYAKMALYAPETDFFIIDPLYPLEGDLSGFCTDHVLEFPD